MRLHEFSFYPNLEMICCHTRKVTQPESSTKQFPPMETYGFFRKCLFKDCCFSTIWTAKKIQIQQRWIRLLAFKRYTEECTATGMNPLHRNSPLSCKVHGYFAKWPRKHSIKNIMTNLQDPQQHFSSNSGQPVLLQSLQGGHEKQTNTLLPKE